MTHDRRTIASVQGDHLPEVRDVARDCERSTARAALKRFEHSKRIGERAGQGSHVPGGAGASVKEHDAGPRAPILANMESGHVLSA